MVDRLALPEGVCEQSVSIDIFNTGIFKKYILSLNTIIL